MFEIKIEKMKEVGGKAVFSYFTAYKNNLIVMCGYF